MRNTAKIYRALENCFFLNKEIPKQLKIEINKTVFRPTLKYDRE